MFNINGVCMVYACVRGCTVPIACNENAANSDDVLKRIAMLLKKKKKN